jgi:N-acetylglucosamine-6-phosphate deacetylase
MTEPLPPNLLLRNARIVLPDQVMEGGTISVEQGRIASIANLDLGSLAERDGELDLAGLTVYPGFIDVHIHGAAGVDMMEASAADIAHVSQFLATQGVIGWLPTLVPAPIEDYVRAVKAIDYAMQSHRGARILGVHYEGPFVNSAQCGALRTQFFRTFSGIQDLDDLPVFVYKAARHMITVAPEIAGGIELVRELIERGWVVSLGHTRATFDLLDQAFSAGARHMTHFMNAMAPFHHRAPGPVAWGLCRDDVSCDVIADGVHLDPQILRLLVKVKSPKRLSLISDAVAATGMGDGDYEIWGETIAVKDGRTSNSRGTIAGSVITMLDAVRMMRSLGVSEVDLAKMAATNPARLIGIDDNFGSIEEGKRGDLIALDPGGTVRLCIIGGFVAFNALAHD